MSFKHDLYSVVALNNSEVDVSSFFFTQSKPTQPNSPCYLQGHIATQPNGSTVNHRISLEFSWRRKQVAQLSQRNRAEGWVSFEWVVGDGMGQTNVVGARK